MIAVIGAAALLLAMGTLEERPLPRRVRKTDRLFFDVVLRGQAPPSSIFEQVDEAAATMLALVPVLYEVLGNTTLVLDSTRSGGWFLPGSKQLVIGWKDGHEVGFFVHEAMHALDDYLGRGQWASGDKTHGLYDPTERARHLMSAQLDAYSDQVAIQSLEPLPVDLRQRLTEGEVLSLDEAVHLLLEAHGSRLDPRRVADLLMDNRGPFGGIDRSRVEQVVGPDLIEGLLVLGKLLPVGVPFSVLSTNDPEQTKNYLRSVRVSDVIRQCRTYHRSLHEVFARMADQSIRRAAEATSSWLPPTIMAAPLHLPDSALLDLEPAVWGVVRRREFR